MHLIPNKEALSLERENKEWLCKAVEILLDEHRALLRVAGEAALLVAHCDLSQDRNAWLHSMSTLSHSIDALPEQLLEDIFLLTLSEKDNQQPQEMLSIETDLVQNISTI